MEPHINISPPGTPLKSSFKKQPSRTPIHTPQRQFPRSPNLRKPSSPTHEPKESPYQKYENKIDDLSAQVVKLLEEFEKNGLAVKEVEFYSNNGPQEKQEITSEFNIEEIQESVESAVNRKTEKPPQKTLEFDEAKSSKKQKKLSECFPSGHKHQTSVGEILLDIKDKILINKTQVEALMRENNFLKQENMSLVKTIEELNEGKRVTKVIENCQFPETHRNLETSFREEIKQRKDLELRVEKYTEVIRDIKGEEFAMQIEEELFEEQRLHHYYSEKRSVSPIVRMEPDKKLRKRNSEGAILNSSDNLNIMETIAKKNTEERRKMKGEMDELIKKLECEKKKLEEVEKEKNEVEENFRKVNEEFQEYLKNTEKVLSEHRKEKETHEKELVEKNGVIANLNKEKGVVIREKEEISKRLKEKDEEIGKKDEEILKRNKDIEVKNKEIEEKVKLIEEKNKEIAQVQQELTKKIDEKKEIKTLKETNKKLSDENTSFKKTNETLTKKQAELESNLKKANEAIKQEHEDRLKTDKSLKELEEFKLIHSKKVIELGFTAKHLKDMVASQELQITELSETKEKLTQEKNNLRAENEKNLIQNKEISIELEKLNKINQELKQNIDSKDLKINEILQEKQRSLEKANRLSEDQRKNLHNKEEQLRKYEEEMSVYDLERQGLQKEIKEKDGKINDLITKLKEKSKEIKEITSELNVLRENEEDFRVKFEMVTSELDAKSMNHLQIEFENQSLREKVIEFEEEKERLKMRNEEIYQNMVDICNKKTRRISEVEDKNHLLRQKIEVITNNTLEENKILIESLKKDVESRENELGVLRNEKIEQLKNFKDTEARLNNLVDLFEKTKQLDEQQQKELRQAKIIHQTKDQEIFSLKNSLYEIKDGLQTQINLCKEELEIDKALVREEVQEKIEEIRLLLVNIDKLEEEVQKTKQSQELAQKKIEILTKTLKEKEEVQKRSQDEQLNRNKQIEKENIEHAKERLKLEAEIGRLSQEIDLLKARFTNNNSLDITGTSSVEDDERRFREFEEKSRNEIMGLQQELENNRISNKNLQEKLETMKLKIDYEELYKKLEVDYEELRRNHEKIQKELLILQNKMKEFEETETKEKILKEKAQQKIKELTTQIELKEEEINKKKGEYLLETQEKLKYMGKIKEIEDQVVILQTEKRKLKESCDKLNREIEELGIKLSEVNHDKNILAALKQENEKIMRENKSKIDALKEEIDAKNSETGKREKNLQNECEELKMNLMNFENEKKKMMMECQKLKQENERNILEAKEMEERARISQETVEEITKDKKRLEELLHENKKYESMYVENSQLIHENENLKKENMVYQSKNHDFDKILKELELKCKEIERKDFEMSEKNRIIEEKTKEISFTTANMEKKLNEKEKELQEKLKEIESKKKDSQTMIEEKCQELAAQNIKISQLNREISSLKQEVADKARSLEKKKLELTTIEKEIAQVKQLLSSTKQSLATQDNEIALLKQEISQKEELSKKNPNEVTFLKSELSTKIQEISGCEEKIKLELESKNEAIKQKLEMENILKDKDQMIVELRERENHILLLNKQKLDEATRLNREIQNKYEESIQKYTMLAEELQTLKNTFQTEMKEKELEKSLFGKELFLEYKLENEELNKKLGEYESKIAIEKIKVTKELKLLKSTDISMKMSLEMITDQCTKLLASERKKMEKKLVKVERKLSNFKNLLTKIHPLLVALGNRIMDPTLKEKQLIILLMQAIMSHSNDKKTEKIGEFKMSPEKYIKDTPITMKSTADASTVKKKQEAAVFVGENSLEMIRSLDDIVKGNVCFISNKKVFDMMEKNLVNSWKFFEILQDILIGFKGLIIESAQESKHLGEIRKAYEGLVAVIKGKNEEFQKKVKSCKEVMETKEGKIQITNEFFQNFEFGENLIGTIHARKGEFIEISRMIQNHIDFCFKERVLIEMNKVFAKNIMENKEILGKRIQN